MRLRSFKLRFADLHVRIVPATDSAGCPFSGPGVDLRGDEAAHALALAAPLVAALADAEPGITVRSMAVDLERPRVTATLDPTAPNADVRDRVIRLDDGAVLRRVIDRSGALQEHLAQQAADALSRRGLRDPHEV